MTGEEVLDMVGYFVTLKESTEALLKENTQLREKIAKYERKDTEILEGRG